MPKRIRKAVIPAAGLGTRFLPATKAVPKEMIPVAGRPLIQFAIEEAAAAGIETVIVVTGLDNHLFTRYFSRDTHFEQILLQRGRDREAALIRRLSEMAEIRTVCQKIPLGLGDAVRTVGPEIGEEPFAVILPDALIDSRVPCIGQLMNCYDTHPGCIVATQTVEASEVDRFGILEVVPISGSAWDDRTLIVRSLIERPTVGSVPHRHGIFGRYVLEPEIFACIERTKPGFNGEVQLTDALELFSKDAPLYAYQFDGDHYDAGSKLGFVKATLAYALKDPEMAAPLRAYLCALGMMPETAVQRAN